ncbi:hypothetical protein COV42_00825 [Candidatus Campbellbacteria bacterium CG11_big_fil_rev_8_21_14_0_20_44_21]|nr:MAG: hypothetical protein COV42_00825 [Candidatus Campbellbacteria bacterium CG11_big_fil_rev_8_21_14_0_20_44_21]
MIDEDKVVIEPIKTKEDLVNLRRRSTTEEFLRISGENYPIDENSNISYISHEVSSNEEIIITGFGYYTSGKAEDIKAKWLSFAEEASWVREEEEGERRLKFTETSGVPVFISIEQDSDSQTLQYVVVEIGESYLF